MNWLKRRDQNDPLMDFGKKMNDLFDDFFDIKPLSMREQGFKPGVDISEDEKAIYFQADLPGLKEQEIDVDIKDNRLTIKGEKKHESEEKNKDYHVTERHYGYFERSFSLPKHVDVEKAAAKYQNGVLTVELPKDPKAAPKKVKINLEK